MEIWKCSGCSELVIADVYPTKGWRFNGTCYQHDCECIKKIIRDCNYSPDYKFASERFSGGEVLAIIDQLKAKLEAVAGWMSIVAMEDGGTKEELQTRLSKYATEIPKLLSN